MYLSKHIHRSNNNYSINRMFLSASLSLVQLQKIIKKDKNEVFELFMKWVAGGPASDAMYQKVA